MLTLFLLLNPGLLKGVNAIGIGIKNSRNGLPRAGRIEIAHVSISDLFFSTAGQLMDLLL
jgi:hypothetical protein